MLREDYVERVAQVIQAADTALLRELVGELHQADVGDLIKALDPELRPRLVELMGSALRFSALTEVDDTVREEILEGLPAETVAEGVRELDSDDAVVILEDLPKDEQAEVSTMPPISGSRSSAASTTRNTRPAGACRPSSSRWPRWTVGRTIDYMRETPDLPERFWDSTWPIRTVAQRHVGLDRLLDQACGADRGLVRGGLRLYGRPTTRRKWRVCSSVTIWSLRRWSTRRASGRCHHLRRYRRRDRGSKDQNGTEARHNNVFASSITSTISSKVITPTNRWSRSTTGAETRS